MVREGVAARERVLFSGFRREDASGIIQARPLEVLHDERGEEVTAREGAVGSSGGGFEAVLLLHSLEDARAELSLELGEDARREKTERLCVSRDDETVRGRRVSEGAGSRGSGGPHEGLRCGVAVARGDARGRRVDVASRRGWWVEESMVAGRLGEHRARAGRTRNVPA